MFPSAANRRAEGGEGNLDPAPVPATSDERHGVQPTVELSDQLPEHIKAHVMNNCELWLHSPHGPSLVYVVDGPPASPWRDIDEMPRKEEIPNGCFLPAEKRAMINKAYYGSFDMSQKFHKMVRDRYVREEKSHVYNDQEPIGGYVKLKFEVASLRHVVITVTSASLHSVGSLSVVATVPLISRSFVFVGWNGLREEGAKRG